jgi:hypothetical protein
MDKRIGGLLLCLFAFLTVAGQKKQASGKTPYFKRIGIDYQGNKAILDVLLLLPDNAMTSWSWTLKERKVLVDSVRKYNHYTDTTPYNNIRAVKSHYLDLQVVDGTWSVARYDINEKDFIVIANTIIGDGNFIKVFEYANGKLRSLKREAVIGAEPVLLRSLLKKDNAECRAALASAWGYSNYDFSDKNKLIITARSLTKKKDASCFRDNRMTFVFNPALKKFEVEKANSLVSYQDSMATEFFKRDTGWNAGDGAFSVPLSDGRVLWTFGDSYVDAYNANSKTVPCLFNVRSAALIQPADHSWEWKKSITVKAHTKSLFENPEGDKFWLWPAGGIQLADTVYVFCFNLASSNVGLGFKSNSTDLLFKLKFPEMKITGSSYLQDFNGISFGQGFIKDEQSGFVYVYGSKGHIPGKVYVARFPIKKPNSKWLFWNGSGWDKDIKKISAIAEGPGYSNTVSKIKNKYVVTTTEFSIGCDKGKNIYVATSDKPVGPFTKSKLIYSIPDRLEGHSPFFYAANIHPEFINDKDEVVLTYCINGYGDCVKTCIDGKYDPNHYRPKAVRVPLKLIDDSF